MSPSTASNIIGQQSAQNRKGIMNTADKIINELAINVANLTVEVVNYKVLYKEVQEQLMHINNVLAADEALKELFDEIANKQKGE